MILPSVLTWLRGYAAALGSVALVTLFIGFVLGQVSLANSSMLYLLAVLATAVAFGRLPAVFASIAAFLAFDFFFVEPLHQFNVSDPGEWLSLILFMLTATVTGQFAAGQRQRAREATQREREAVVLYDVVRLMGESDLEDALQAVAERLRGELQLPALAVEFWRPTGELVRIGAGNSADLKSAETRSTSTSRVLQPGRPAAVDQHAAPGRWVRIVPTVRGGTATAAEPPPLPAKVDVVPIRVGERRLGALVLVHPTRNSTQPTTASSRPLPHRSASRWIVAGCTRRLPKVRSCAAPISCAPRCSTRCPTISAHPSRRSWPRPAACARTTSPGRTRSARASPGHRRGGRAPQPPGWQPARPVAHRGRQSTARQELARLRCAGRRRRGASAADRRPPSPAQSVPTDLPPLWLDSVEIGEALYNLVENAAKYSPRDTEISVEVRAEADVVQVGVSDRGPGISPAALPHLFDPFYRAIDGSGATPRPQGLGLGLAVVKGLVEAHGGRVWAENRAGGGARFVFTLPADADVGAPPAPEVNAA